MVEEIMVVFGTRPELIKLYPIIERLRHHSHFRPVLCNTGQHAELLDDLIEFYELEPEYNLKVLKAGQSLSELTASLISNLQNIMTQRPLSGVIVHGDTTSALCGALSAFYNRLRIGHVEAGLRTKQLYSPFPEEANRSLISQLTDLHFAPTASAKLNLIAEGKADDNISVTGNTVVDSLLMCRDRIARDANRQAQFYDRFKAISFDKKIIIVTAHRRENADGGFQNIALAINRLSEKYRDLEFIFPVHLNPSVRRVMFKELSGRENIHLVDPMTYPDFVFLMAHAFCILTDSGGIQEEAPTFGVPVLLMRDSSERPEAIESGLAFLVGSDVNLIVESFDRVYSELAMDTKQNNNANPFGDGYASERIIGLLEERWL